MAQIFGVVVHCEGAWKGCKRNIETGVMAPEVPMLHPTRDAKATYRLCKTVAMTKNEMNMKTDMDSESERKKK